MTSFRPSVLRMARLLQSVGAATNSAAAALGPLAASLQAPAPSSLQQPFLCSPVLRALSGRHASTSASGQDYVSLNTIADHPGATHYSKRLGRGIGSGLGKTSGRGHKGQNARTGRSPKAGFEGGQTPLRKRAPRRGFHNPGSITWDVVSVGAIQAAVRAGKLDGGCAITMKALRDAGVASKRVDSGVKLLADGAARLRDALHLQVSQASAAAKEAVERAGGSVTMVYYNALGLRALLKPESFARKGRALPRPARAPPRLAPRFDRLGSLPPQLGLPVAGQSAGAVEAGAAA